jgi:leucyl aminopeptidase
LILLQSADPGAPALPDVIAIGLGPHGPLFGDLADPTLPTAVRDAVLAHVGQAKPSAVVGKIHPLPMPGQRPSWVLLAGLGSADDTRPAQGAGSAHGAGSAQGAGSADGVGTVDRAAAAVDDLRVAAVALGRYLQELDGHPKVAVALPAAGAAASAALAEGLVLGGYRFDRRTGTEEELRVVTVLGDVDPAGIARGDDAADAAGWARDLGNTPAAELTPRRMAELASDQLTAAGCRVDVHEGEWLAERHFGGLLAVGAAAACPPCLIEAAYRPSRPRAAKALTHVVLVGKGITFDTGGLNLKPPDAMRMMHTDMCGGAAVLGAIHYAAARQLPVRVTILVPAAENAVSGGAMRPSDVLAHYNGRTTEVGNTDAEGRLVLADALAYAVDRLKPDVLIDVATLTGAMKIALGLRAAGLFANDDVLAAQLIAAGEVAGEPLWRMPLEHRYLPALDSPVADARNDPSGPGAITAALFLQPFVGSVPWAHLDIAGPARATDAGPLFSRGATGFGVRLLARYLDALSETGPRPD